MTANVVTVIGVTTNVAAAMTTAIVIGLNFRDEAKTFRVWDFRIVTMATTWRSRGGRREGLIPVGQASLPIIAADGLSVSAY